MKFKSIVSIILLILSFSCKNASEDEKPQYLGKVYFKISLSPALNGEDVLEFKSEDQLIIVEVDSVFQTEEFDYLSMKDLEYQIIISSRDICYSATVEAVFNQKSFNKQEFEMGRSFNSGNNAPCKDNYEKVVKIKTPN